MGIVSSLKNRFARKTAVTGQAEHMNTSELGYRPTPERLSRLEFALQTVDYELRAVIHDIRMMDKADGRVKRIHDRIARDVTRGGLVIIQSDPSSLVQQEWHAFVNRLQLNNAQKLKSDARGLIIEGNLPIQWVLDEDCNVVAGIRMPSETILPKVGVNGRFKDIKEAFVQYDYRTGQNLAVFPLWQLTLARNDPDNFDDLSCMGRPFLDGCREIWRKLRMTDTDLVIRRRARSPMRLAHVMENASKDELEEYRANVEANKDQIATDFYMNKKGTVSAIQGDVNLGEINDVVYLLDSFFSGSPVPKGLAGYTDGLSRDILEDLKRDYFDEVDQLQDVLAWVYQQGFRLHLLLKGVNADAENFKISFAERRTESLSQTTDRVLKLKALGLPDSMLWEELGYNPEDVEARRENDEKNYDPYPDISQPRISITPSNARKGDSATSISNG
ncbi:hypothetical protein BGI05_05240 [Snodgrassella alvi]|uniref:portal protein n=1 Tax=Snodgrassella alvi TaxID=1196083 RepID=UPI000A04A0F2|nr:portal protein [Snodgrassella alvi]ORF03590.1 hypothetical protein BGH97_02490 [Snodgrassella alvi]ORF09366.1 hypothetical protein BGH99_02465 [Snodgrassella alvi]ORF14717.1 hypothetical protein BGI00_01880 [Snodgrassella alvi]ORF15889.1 hypothetical protein BGI02_01910 [Snodgrassella alvi]ORF21014.1 hypothetical protein BGI05_05240 [Snodgrassella alvi]